MVRLETGHGRRADKALPDQIINRVEYQGSNKNGLTLYPEKDQETQKAFQ